MRPVLLLSLLLLPVCGAVPESAGQRRRLQKNGPPTESEAVGLGLGAPVAVGRPASSEEAKVEAPAAAAAAAAVEPASAVTESQPQPPAGAVMVVVPEGMAAGQAMIVTSTDGTQVQVVIPAGVSPGQSLQVQMPLPAPVVAAAALPADPPPAVAPPPAATGLAPDTAAPPLTAPPTPSASNEEPQPVAFTKQAAADLPQHTVTIHGTPVKFAVTAQRHVDLILGHIKRELHGYGECAYPMCHQRSARRTTGQTCPRE
jgi:hypothetical protein